MTAAEYPLRQPNPSGLSASYIIGSAMPELSWGADLVGIRYDRQSRHLADSTLDHRFNHDCFPVELDHVAGRQLFAAASFDFAIDLGFASLDSHLRFAAGGHEAYKF
ncbi:hypothetical protein Poly59_08760 [Rubripirellula reticaptiva]|uniref:Uncharacterized protein n=1 Tax=Rubripirellula reticaptiva TaxID=2528013 RepID=A0A5C6FBM7_9BACT|nr:hypothetical protein Poly59_08760 [Rubripirellula reticaptiva]